MDDLYPNDGQFSPFHEPEEQVVERNVGTSKAQAAKPVLIDLIAKLTDDITRMGMVSAIKVDPEADPDSFMKAWYGVQEVTGYAMQLREYMESLLVDIK